MPKRLDAEDTVESAVHFLNKLAADGWGVVSLTTDVDYDSVGPKGKSLPYAATVTVRLAPTVKK